MSRYRICAGLVALFALLHSCKEIGPEIVKSQAALIDTFYTTSIPAKDTRMVVIEEFTGAKCTSCPQGHQTVKNLVDANPGRIAAIAYHKFGSSLDEPVYLEEPDFDAIKDDYRRDEATNIMNAVFGNVANIPQAGIDRIFNAGETVYLRPLWAGTVNNQLNVPSALNLDLNLSMANDNKSAILTVKGIYTEAAPEKQVLTIVLLENELISPQKYPDSTSKKYHHEHVFRKAYTPSAGRPVLTSVSDILPGQAFELALKLDFESLWNLNNCEIVAFVSNNGQTNKVIQQAAQIKLVP